MYKCLMALKTRNSVVIAPHPSAAKCSAEAARIICEAAVRAGAPKDIVQCLEKPSLQLTQELMNSPEINLIWATGGHKLVRFPSLMLKVNL
jgi:acetaldehyde dehydrogenase/alcohol dehydrogenase